MHYQTKTSIKSILRSSTLKLLKAKVKNFGSYKELEFDFENQGLILIYGNTGSGKSTIQDIANWCLFGTTAKGGNADDIKAWNATGPTLGELTVKATDGTYLAIVRQRSPNDLHWYELDQDATTISGIQRGKDLTETQKRLEERLGVSEELYTTAACYNEFSLTSNFFTAKAKDRRELIDKISDLEFTINLAERISDVKKETKIVVGTREKSLSKCNGKLENATSTLASLRSSEQKWTTEREDELVNLTLRSQNFEKEKESKIAATITRYDSFENKKADEFHKELEFIATLVAKLKDVKTEECPTCGRVDEDATRYKEKIHEARKRLRKSAKDPNPYNELLEQAKSIENSYDDQIAKVKDRRNPFTPKTLQIEKEIENLQEEQKEHTQYLEALNYKQDSLEHLREVNDKVRGHLIRRSLKSVETECNRYLEAYFDSEIRITLDSTEDDTIDLFIQKSGNECNFKQLSRGQRSILRLCFSVSVAEAAANKSGVHFDTLMFDEVCDGLDSTLKVRAFSLFSEIANRHGSVIIIDHSTELQNMFNKRYHVELIEDNSYIHEQTS
jgi:DNA repair exonuclease SbcCD ATPase subunit